MLLALTLIIHEAGDHDGSRPRVHVMIIGNRVVEALFQHCLAVHHSHRRLLLRAVVDEGRPVQRHGQLVDRLLDLREMDLGRCQGIVELPDRQMVPAGLGSAKIDILNIVAPIHRIFFERRHRLGNRQLPERLQVAQRVLSDPDDAVRNRIFGPLGVGHLVQLGPIPGQQGAIPADKILVVHGHLDLPQRGAVGERTGAQCLEAGSDPDPLQIRAVHKCAVADGRHRVRQLHFLRRIGHFAHAVALPDGENLTSDAGDPLHDDDSAHPLVVPYRIIHIIPVPEILAGIVFNQLDHPASADHHIAVVEIRPCRTLSARPRRDFVDGPAGHLEGGLPGQMVLVARGRHRDRDGSVSAALQRSVLVHRDDGWIARTKRDLAKTVHLGPDRRINADPIPPGIRRHKLLRLLNRVIPLDKALVVADALDPHCFGACVDALVPVQRIVDVFRQLPAVAHDPDLRLLLSPVVREPVLRDLNVRAVRVLQADGPDLDRDLDGLGLIVLIALCQNSDPGLAGSLSGHRSVLGDRCDGRIFARVGDRSLRPAYLDPGRFAELDVQILHSDGLAALVDDVGLFHESGKVAQALDLHGLDADHGALVKARLKLGAVHEPSVAVQNLDFRLLLFSVVNEFRLRQPDRHFGRILDVDLRHGYFERRRCRFIVTAAVCFDGDHGRARSGAGHDAVLRNNGCVCILARVRDRALRALHLNGGRRVEFDGKVLDADGLRRFLDRKSLLDASRVLLRAGDRHRRRARVDVVLVRHGVIRPGLERRSVIGNRHARLLGFAVICICGLRQLDVAVLDALDRKLRGRRHCAARRARLNSSCAALDRIPRAVLRNLHDRRIRRAPIHTIRKINRAAPIQAELGPQQELSGRAPGSHQLPEDLALALHIIARNIEHLHAFAGHSHRRLAQPGIRRELAGRRVVISGSRTAKSAQPHINIAGIDHRRIVARDCALRLVDPVRLLLIPLLDALGLRAAPVPREHFPVSPDAGRTHQPPVRLPVQPRMRDRKSALRRAHPRNILQISRPLDRHIVRLRQRLPRPRIAHALLTGLPADLIDPGNRRLRVRDILPGHTCQNTPIRSAVYIRRDHLGLQDIVRRRRPSPGSGLGFSPLRKNTIAVDDLHSGSKLLLGRLARGRLVLQGRRVLQGSFVLGGSALRRLVFACCLAFLC